MGVPSGDWLARWRGGLSLLETGHDRSYEFLHWVRIGSCRGGPFHGISDFQTELPFRWFGSDLLFGKCGLAKSGPTHGLDVGSRPVGSPVVQSAHRWPGVGLVLGVCRWLCLLQARHPLANTSCLGCMTARQCAKVLAGGFQW